MALGCASKPWPKVKGVSDPRFSERAVTTVDVLPIDVQVWTYQGSKYDPEAISRGLDSQLRSMLGAELGQRGYDIAAMLDWDGSYPGRNGAVQAMTERDLAVTTVALSSYGAAQAKAKDGLLVPYLPARLGTATGSDATLYVGGWAYAGKDPKRSSTGAKVAKGIGIGLLVVAIVAVAVIAAKKGGGGLGKAAGGVAKAAAKAGSGAVKAAGGFGRVAARTIGTTARGLMRAGVVVTKHGPRIAVDTLDCFGRVGFDTHVHLQPYRVDYSRQPRTPRAGRSAMLLEMTLIDNRTGRTLWHARRRFQARPVRGNHVSKAVHRLMASLPSSTGGPPGMMAALSSR